jgi:phosphoribosylamine--glycine ligase
VGSGGREHALARAIAADPKVEAVHVAPGNPGTQTFAKNHEADILDGSGLASLAKRFGINLVVIGPEAPLVAGVAEVIRRAGIPCFGPGKEAAQLEGSKAFAKEIMKEAGVPTAASRVFEQNSFQNDNADDQAPAEYLAAVGKALDEFGTPYVVKADGLAAGKGVVVTEDREAALAHAANCERVVIEEYLDGPEVSLFAICDGTTALPMQPAQDFKRAYDRSRGPNTGGMGSYTPLPWLPADTVETVMAQVVQPTLATMRDRGTPFTGLLYVGLAMTKLGPKVVEFNVRFGDPETEALLPMLASPLGQVLYAAAQGELEEIGELEWHPGACVGVVMAAEGYPGTPVKGQRIVLPPDTPTAHIIQAGTATERVLERPEPGSPGTWHNELVADGGRVLVVLGRGKDVPTARRVAYKLLDQVEFPQSFYRSDIASPSYLASLATK